MFDYGFVVGIALPFRLVMYFHFQENLLYIGVEKKEQFKWRRRAHQIYLKEQRMKEDDRFEREASRLHTGRVRQFYKNPWDKVY